MLPMRASRKIMRMTPPSLCVLKSIDSSFLVEFSVIAACPTQLNNSLSPSFKLIPSRSIQLKRLLEPVPRETLSFPLT